MFLENKEKTIEMGKKSYLYARDHFSIKTHIDCHEKLYENLIVD